MTTLSEWENELAALRADLGPTRPMLMTWVATYESAGIWKKASIARWEVVLYPPDACDGDHPVALTYLPADAPLPSEQPVLVEVAGRTDPGGALAFLLPSGTVLYGSYPARQPGLFPRWRMLLGRRISTERWRRAWVSSSAVPRGVILLVVALVVLAQHAWVAAAISAAAGLALLCVAWRSS